MKIIILGAGQVGTSMAEILSGEENDITLVDIDPEKLAGLQDRLDIRTVTGAASHPSVLEQAGGQDADLVLAVTNQDEVNMASCQIAHSLFIPRKRLLGSVRVSTCRILRSLLTTPFRLTSLSAQSTSLPGTSST